LLKNFKPDYKNAIKLSKTYNSYYCSREFLIISYLLKDENFLQLLEENNLNLESVHAYLNLYNGLDRHKYIWERGYYSKSKNSYNKNKMDFYTKDIDEFTLERSSPVFNNPILTKIPKTNNYISNLIKNLSEGSKKVLIIGESGVGKSSIVDILQYKIDTNSVPNNLQYNRVIYLDIPKIISLGIVDGPKTLFKLVNEFRGTKNTIIFLDNIHLFYSIQGVDYLNILSGVFENNNLKVIASSDFYNYSKYLSNQSFLQNNFAKIDMVEFDNAELSTFLKYKNKEYSKKLTFKSLNFLVKNINKVNTNRKNPGKAVDIINAASSLSSNSFISSNNLINAVENISGIKIGNMEETEKDVLINLKNNIEKELVGQRDAVDTIVNTLLLERSGLVTNIKKPIGSFLFVGPTGVGKTELAKSLSRNYFKGESSIIRLDMSEYQSAQDIDKIIGNASGSIPGGLTQKILKNPFNLILLDEFEKASKNIHMLFLQILDEGSIKDGMGREISFSNSIIIATSNLATNQITDALKSNTSLSIIKSNIRESLKSYLPVELINRFSDVILFNPLSKSDLNLIFDIKFTKFKSDLLKNKGINLKLDKDIKNLIIEKSYSIDWGARELDRKISEIILYPISKALLSNTYPADHILEIDTAFLSKYSGSKI